MDVQELLNDTLGYGYCKSFFRWLSKGNPRSIVIRLLRDTYGEQDVARVLDKLDLDVERNCIKRLGLYFRVDARDNEDRVYPFVMAFPVKQTEGGSTLFNPTRIEFFMSNTPMDEEDESEFVCSLRDDCGVHSIEVVDDCLTRLPYGYILSMVDRYQQRNLRGKGVQQ